MQNNLRKLWGISLLFISCISLIIGICNLVSADLPDILKRILGIAILLDLPVFVYASVKLKIWKKG